MCKVIKAVTLLFDLFHFGSVYSNMVSKCVEERREKTEFGKPRFLGSDEFYSLNNRLLNSKLEISPGKFSK